MCSHRSLPHNNGFRATLVQMLLRVSLRFRIFSFNPKQVNSCYYDCVSSFTIDFSRVIND